MAQRLVAIARGEPPSTASWLEHPEAEQLTQRWLLPLSEALPQEAGSCDRTAGSQWPLTGGTVVLDARSGTGKT